MRRILSAVSLNASSSSRPKIGARKSAAKAEFLAFLSIGAESAKQIFQREFHFVRRNFARNGPNEFRVRAQSPAEANVIRLDLRSVVQSRFAALQADVADMALPASRSDGFASAPPTAVDFPDSRRFPAAAPSFP